MAAPARGLYAYVWPGSVGWSDLGTVERLHAWHRRVERQSVPRSGQPPQQDDLHALRPESLGLHP